MFPTFPHVGGMGMTMGLWGIGLGGRRVGLHWLWVSQDILGGLQSFPCIVQLLLGIKMSGMASRNTPTAHMLPCLAHSIRGWREMQNNPTIPSTKNMQMVREAKFKICRAIYNFLVCGKFFESQKCKTVSGGFVFTQCLVKMEVFFHQEYICKCNGKHTIYLQLVDERNFIEIFQSGQTILDIYVSLPKKEKSSKARRKMFKLPIIENKFD